MFQEATGMMRAPVSRGGEFVRRRTAEPFWVWLVPLLALGLGVALFVPRFQVATPSLVDDWFAITYAPVAVHELAHGHYHASLVDYGGRYRPAYALVAYLQWTILGGAHSVLGPTIFGLLRLFIFMAAVSMLTIAVVRTRATRSQQVVLAAAVPVVVIAWPGVPYNFVRFGVAEPTAFACIVLGLLAMGCAIRLHTLAGRADTIWRPVGLFVAGFCMYLLGIYMWELSVAVVVVLPVLYVWLFHDPALRATGRLPSSRTLALLSLLLLAPIVHVMWEVARATSEGGKLGLAALLVLPLAVTGVRLFVRRARWEDRQSALCLAMIAAGTVAAYASVRTGGSLSRYYIAWLVAIAVTTAWIGTGRFRKVSWALLAIVVVALFGGRPDLQVRGWLRNDLQGGAAISLASQAYATGCTVYLVGFPAERGIGLARLLRSDDPSPRPACDRSARSVFAVAWPATRAMPPSGCTRGWRAIERQRSVTLLTCKDFRPAHAIPSQDLAFKVRTSVVRLVKPSHLVPASALKSAA